MKLKVLFGKSYYLRNFIKKLEEKRTLTKIKKLSDKQKDLLLIKAITEFGDLAIYKVVNGSHGLTLHAYADSPKDATLLRRMIPLWWNGLFTMVIYINTPDEEE
jgi:hypothetical protein|tara:strand:+ start:730 stop:1041 length:312 start_codon:yes stop_codon:yes gene_type:complete